MWKLAALICGLALACLAPFWLFGLKFVGPILVCNIVDWFDHG